jgi:mono/diheme cytochrome c family protein
MRVRACALAAAGWMVFVCASASDPVRALGFAQQGTAASSPAPAVAPQRAVINQYCVGCHSERTKAGGLALDTLDIANVAVNAAVLEKVIRKLEAGVMPPAGLPRPDRPTVDGLVSWLKTQIDRAADAHPNPGRTEAFHRLNRTEYQHAIRDLLDLEINVSNLLPLDDASYGFDNIAGVLKVNQALLERYLSAAAKVSRLAVGRVGPSVAADDFSLAEDFNQEQHVDGLPLGTRGGMLVRYNFPQDAEYDIQVRLQCGPPSQTGGKCDGSGGFVDTHHLEISIDGSRVKLFTLEPRRNGEVTEGGWRVRVPLAAGPHDVAVAFLKPPSIDEADGLRVRSERPYFTSINLSLGSLVTFQPAVDTVTISGPYNATGPGDTPSRRRIFVCRPQSAAAEARCARKILSSLARRAYRRPVSEADVEPLLSFYQDARAEDRTKNGFESGIQAALELLLVQPEFLFRIERDRSDAPPDSNYRISDLELASRLSFFLWASIPDDELLNAASRGVLRRPDVLQRQVRRMLADARSKRFLANFAGQWLQLRNLDSWKPFEALFPDFDDSLRRAMRRETELFFDSVVREDRSALALLTANYSFLNERLAQHYGIPNVSGSHFRRVTFADDNPRRGLLGHGSILTVTSNPMRTSPVSRGKWILENVLGTPPPAPPPNVPLLAEKKVGVADLSVREKMAAHRRNPACAGCHAMIDPLGFALENFDAVGRFRAVEDQYIRDDKETYTPIDASGVLPDGTKFQDLDSFRRILTAHPDRFVTTLTERLLTYALGRGVEYYDMPAVRRIVAGAAKNDYRFSSLILGIVESQPFQTRRSAPGPAAAAIAALRR